MSLTEPCAISKAAHRREQARAPCGQRLQRWPRPGAGPGLTPHASLCPSSERAGSGLARGEAGSSLQGVSDPALSVGFLSMPSLPSRGLDGDVAAPRGLVCTSNSARLRPNSPPASEGSPGLWGGPAQSRWATPTGPASGHVGALAVTMRVSRETLDAQQALGRGASSCRPPASAWPSAPCGWGFRPQPHRPGPPLATAQLPSGYLRPLPALRLSRVTELPYSGVLRSCLRVTCAPLGVGTRALRPAGL